MNDAKTFFTHQHDVVCNQKYNKTLPYSFHLEMVERQSEKFKKYLPEEFSRYNATWNAIWGHDSIEDARMTYNEIKQLFGEMTADIIYLCTENRGKTRDERKNEQWYNELKENDLAVFVKLCDLIANVKFSLLSNSSMFDKYKKEYNQKIRPILFTEKYLDMFVCLDKLFQL